MLIPQPNNLTIWHFFPQLVFSSLITLLPVQPWTGMTLGYLTSSNSFSKDKHISSLRELKKYICFKCWRQFPRRIFLEPGSQHSWVLVETLLLTWGWLLSCYILTWQRALVSSSYKDTTPIMQTPFYDLIWIWSPPKGPTMKCHHIRGQGFKPLILGEHGCSIHSTGSLKFAVKGDDRYYTNDYKPSI